MKNKGVTFEKYRIASGKFVPLFEESGEDFIKENDEVIDGGSDIAIKKWCAIEAILKLDGGGFSSLSRLMDLVKKNDCYAGVIKDNGDRYAFSIAVSKPILKSEI